MVFDQKWVENLLELQKKAEELSKGNNTAAEVNDLVMKTLNQLGVSKFPRIGDLESITAFWTKGLWEQKTGLEPDINITETRDEVQIQALIPGIEDQNGLSIKLRGDALNITGKSSGLGNDGGSSNPRVLTIGPAEPGIQRPASRRSSTITLIPKASTIAGKGVPSAAALMVSNRGVGINSG